MKIPPIFLAATAIGGLFFSVTASAAMCSNLAAYNGTTNDASKVIQTCIDNAPVGGTVELPAGKYYISQTLFINNRLTLRTAGKDVSMPRCKMGDNSDCAEIIAFTDFGAAAYQPALLYVRADGSQIDHLIFNGNGESRTWNANLAGDVSWNCSNGSFTNNIVEKAARTCGFCSRASLVDGANISNNLFAFNGIHNSPVPNKPDGTPDYSKSLWADGATLIEYGNLNFTNNEFADNTDVDLIFGGCKNCVIKNNSIKHSGAFKRGSYSALMLHHWPETTGNFAGSVISNNTVDCGTNNRCGFGLMLGAGPWDKNVDPIAGGSVNGNTINNAQNGIVLNEATNIEIYNNYARNSSGLAYSKGPRSNNLDTSKDTSGAIYAQKDFTAVPNWQCSNNCGASDNSSQFVSQSVPTAMTAGKTYTVSVTMKNTGATTWTEAEKYHIGSQNPQDNHTWNSGRAGLDASESIQPIDSDTKTFTFDVVAPATPGTYNFQWQMVQDGVEWFGDKTPNVAVAVVSGKTACVPNAVSGCKVCKADGSVWVDDNSKCGSGQVCQSGACVAIPKTACSALGSYNGTTNDASAVIQGCIDAAPSGGIVELPAGKYYVAHQVKIAKPITFTTQGKTAAMPRCTYGYKNDCAQLIASTAFGDPGGILATTDAANGTIIDHITVDGNEAARYAAKSAAYWQCAKMPVTARNNWYGMNIWLGSDNTKLTNSQSINALCGTGVQVFGERNYMTVNNNLVAFNGWRLDYQYDPASTPAVLPQPPSDGATFMKCNNCSVVGNDFYDNSDADLIFAGCKNCSINNNNINHSAAWQRASHWALYLDHWDWDADYTGTTVSQNEIDCGSNKNCDYGFQMGNANYTGQNNIKIWGASVHDNTVVNAVQGININDVHDFTIYGNTVTNSGGLTLTLNKNYWCGKTQPATIRTSAYNLGPNSYNIDTSKDAPRPAYSSFDWAGCDASATYNISYASLNNAQFVSQTVPVSMVAGQTYPVSVTMKNVGVTAWTKNDKYRLGYIGNTNPNDWQLWGPGRVELADNEYIEPIDSNTKTFNFTVTAPAKPGTYNFQWQMLKESVEWFGGQTPNVAVTVISGKTACVPGAVSGCKVCKTDGSAWMDTDSQCAAGQKCQSGTCVTACSNQCTKDTKQCSGNGVQTCSDINNDGCTEWSAAIGCAANQTCSGGTCVANNNAGINNAQFVSQSVPAAMVAGKTYSASVAMKNTGITAWSEAQQYRIGAQNPQDNHTWNGGRAGLAAGETIAPGQTKVFTFNVVAPSIPGTYNFQWQMVREMVAWFGDKTTNLAISVVAAPACAANAVSGCQVCKADGSAWVDTDSQCAAGQKCRSGTCVQQILVLDIPYVQLDSMGCGSNANPQANTNCRASRFCATKGLNSGFQAEWGPASGTIVCASGNTLSAAYSVLDSMGCGSNANPAANNACRAARYCLSKGYAAGFETEWAPSGATIQCFDKADKFDVAYNVLEAQGCGDDPNGFKHQACNASRYCGSKGYASGFQTEWGPASASVFCLGDKKMAAANNGLVWPDGQLDNLWLTLSAIRSQIAILSARLAELLR